MTRPTRFALALLAALLLAPAAAPAHEGAHATGLGVAVEGARRAADGAVEAALTLVNATDVALTLRRASCPEADRLRLLRRRSLFGVEVWSAAGLIRLDPGDELRLGPPDYAIRIEGAPPESDLLTLTLDFGPQGARTVVLFVFE